MCTLNFTKVLKENHTIKDHRLFYKQENHSIIEHFLFQLIVGYKTDSSSDILSNNSIFQSVSDKEQLLFSPQCLGYGID